MAVALGIDTGGTYTDAALVDQTSGEVLAETKALTTHHDLSIGIIEAVADVLQSAASPQEGLAVTPGDIRLVGLSTTLATNSIVEGRGSPVCLVLIGYSPSLLRTFGFERELVTDDVVHVPGGHDADGNERTPLDEAGLKAAVLERRDRVSAFAVSGYFGVRNPAHEMRARAIIEELTDPADSPSGTPMPVTCGHELTTRLDSVRRATTAALNARLIPLLRDLIATVRRSLDELQIQAPLMIVKGDGSLVRAAWAMQRPIETILSGPAASVVGAWRLADRPDVWVVDMGGTTTDIAVLHDGRPRLNPEGAQVGGWRTMIETADVHTVGLGGDSHVRLGDGATARALDLIIGPRRVVPLCLLASEHPEVVDELRRQLAAREYRPLMGLFVLSQGRTEPGLSDEDRDLLAALEERPRSLIGMIPKLRYGLLGLDRIGALESRRLVMRAGFTPTDALHVLGRFANWDSRASRLGAEILANRVGLSPEALSERVVREVSNRMTTELVTKVLGDEGHLPDWEGEPSAVALLARAMGEVSESDLDCGLKLHQPVVAVGAPVEAYLPLSARHLDTELVVPRRAEVANAIGAVAGGVVQRIQVFIRPTDGEAPYRVHLPDGVRDFATVDESVAFAEEVVPGHLEVLARQAGADQIEVNLTREDRVAAAQYGQEVFLETELLFVGVGRPSPARDPSG